MAPFLVHNIQNNHMLQHFEPNPENKKSNDNHRNMDIVTKKKIDKHLTDINDVISEEDIKNVNTDIRSGTGEFDDTEPKNMVRSETIRKESNSPWEIEEG